MAKDINALINSLKEIQQCREDRQTMRVPHARVVDSGREFYATIVLSSEAFIIQPDDLSLTPTDSHFRSHHIRGFHEMGHRGIRLNLYNNAQPIIEVYFRTDRQMARALRRLRQITGCESTSESS